MGKREDRELATQSQVRTIDGVVARPIQGVRATKRSSRFQNKALYYIGAALIAALLVAGWYFLLSPNGRINQSRYQAVFLANGQVYFGKLSGLNGRYATLKDVYYLQTDTSESADSEASQQPSSDQRQLIKLGEELHSPEDEMLISRDQILFWENLKDGGSVVEAIQNYQKREK